MPKSNAKILKFGHNFYHCSLANMKQFLFAFLSFISLNLSSKTYGFWIMDTSNISINISMLGDTLYEIKKSSVTKSGTYKIYYDSTLSAPYLETEYLEYKILKRSFFYEGGNTLIYFNSGAVKEEIIRKIDPNSQIPKTYLSIVKVTYWPNGKRRFISITDNENGSTYSFLYYPDETIRTYYNNTNGFLIELNFSEDGKITSQNLGKHQRFLFNELENPIKYCRDSYINSKNDTFQFDYNMVGTITYDTIITNCIQINFDTN